MNWRNKKNLMTIQKEMGFSHQEFFSSLAILARDIPCRLSDSGAVLEYDAGEVRISLGPQGERKLGSMILPRTMVSLEFKDFSEEQRMVFLDRFDLTFRRGGG
jgi:hypothetical protein